ncbi:MAG: hypothetical protein MN733_00040 [Nitrososphaera sp.]|nr:hypothetical protein [Nitrososphaera sp.]
MSEELFKMEIVNETVYNSDDIRELLLAIYRTCDAVGYRRIYYRSFPSKLRIGYYTPSIANESGSRKKRKRSRRSPQKAALAAWDTGERSRDNTIPRLGIVRHKFLYNSALECLAQVADGDQVVPKAALYSIARVFINCYYDAYIIDDNFKNGTWEWLSNFKLRYDLRRKRDPKGTAEARKIKRERKVTLLESKIDNVTSDIRSYLYAIDRLESRRDELSEKLRRYKEKFNIKD